MTAVLEKSRVIQAGLLFLAVAGIVAGPAIAAGNGAAPSGYAIVPVQLSMGRPGPGGPPPARRTTPPANPNAGLTAAEQKQLVLQMSRLTPKERSKLVKAVKRMSPEQRMRFFAAVKRQLGKIGASPQSPKSAM
jgi:hypothetical protein